MRRSFSGNRGGAGGGGGGSNGNMLKTLARTVSRANTIKQETSFSTSSINKNSIKSPTSPTAVTKSRNNCITSLSLSSPTGSDVNSMFVTSPIGQYKYGSCSWRNDSCESDVCDDVDWVCVDHEFSYFDDDFVLGSVPSRYEAQSAVTALQQYVSFPFFF